jgi:AraC-like DNA-binding protein
LPGCTCTWTIPAPTACWRRASCWPCSASCCLAPERHALADPQLRFLRDHLLARLDERHSLEDLAALFGLDRFAFLRQFKKKTGMTPYAWLKRLRLEQSKRLLGSGLPVSEVALAVGFFDQSHFHHGFRQAFGLTPADFRQQMLAA